MVLLNHSNVLKLMKELQSIICLITSVDPTLSSYIIALLMSAAQFTAKTEWNSRGKLDYISLPDIKLYLPPGRYVLNQAVWMKFQSLLSIRWIYFVLDNLDSVGLISCNM